MTAAKEWKGANAPSPAEGLIEIEGEQATLLVPVDRGEARLDATVGPIDLHSVGTEITGRGVGLTLFASNTSPRDREVTLEAVLLDGSGKPIGRKTRRQDVEEGECGERLGVRWILSGDQLATARTVRVVVSWRLD